MILAVGVEKIETSIQYLMINFNGEQRALSLNKTQHVFNRTDPFDSDEPPHVESGFKILITRQEPQMRGKDNPQPERCAPLQIKLIVPKKSANLSLIKKIVASIQKQLFELNRIITGTPRDMTGYSDQLIIEETEESLIPSENVDDAGNFVFTHGVG